MNSKKISLALLACLIFGSNFQILGSAPEKTRTEKEVAWTEKLKIAGLGTALAIIISLTISETIFEGMDLQAQCGNYTTSLCACVNEGGSSGCLNQADEAFSDFAKSDRSKSLKNDI